MFRFSLALICCALIAGNCVASSESIGFNGINSAVMQGPAINLTGTDIGIGQVEIERSGLPDSDPNVNVHADVVPAEVFRRSGAAVDADISDHATNVAGVMISKNAGALAGVAKNAKLYASAFLAQGILGDQILVTNNHVARRNGRDVRAINHSWGVDFGGDADGGSYLTVGLDWSASTHEVLHVVAGGQGNDVPQPADNFNGMTIAYSERVNGVFRKVHSGNVLEGNATQDRTFIDLLAPGDGFPMTNQNSMSTVPPHPEGTSFAAPHVTGTVALLQELADRQIRDVGDIHWDSDNPKRHEVMKAVLMNSADKLAGVHGSNRTVVSNDASNNYTWEGSLASINADQALDIQFGAGHLNALRAATQLAPGEWDNDIPFIGWDYGETGGMGTTIRYPFAESLDGDEWIAITLAWDRTVQSTGTDGNYNTFDMYTIPGPAGDYGVNNLELYLLPDGWTDISEAGDVISVATHQNLEHIFAKVPADGDYEIVVRQVNGGPNDDVDFGLAWWFGNPFATALLGDFDKDGDVDNDDLDQWEDDYGQNGDSDADGDGDSDGQDFLAWQRDFGIGTLSATIAVPEPASGLLLVMCAWALPYRKRSACLVG